MRAAEDPGEDAEQLEPRERRGDEHVEQPVVDDGVGREPHPAADARGVADRDEHGVEVPGVPVDRHPVAPCMEAGDLEQHRHDVPRRAGETRHAVRPLVDEGVEPGREHADEPAARADPDGVDRRGRRRTVGERRHDARHGGGRIVVREAEAAGHVVAGARRDDADRDGRLGEGVDRRVQRAVTPDHDDGVGRVPRRSVAEQPLHLAAVGRVDAADLVPGGAERGRRGITGGPPPPAAGRGVHRDQHPCHAGSMTRPGASHSAPGRRCAPRRSPTRAPGDWAHARDRLLPRRRARGPPPRRQEVREPGPGEVRVRIAVSGVNPTDWKSRAGTDLAYDQVPNQDGAGIVDAVGAGVPFARRRPGVALGVGVRAAGGHCAGAGRRAADRAVLLPGRRVVRPRRRAGRARAHRPPRAPHRRTGPLPLAPGELGGKIVLVAGGAGAVGHAAIQLAAGPAPA